MRSQISVIFTFGLVMMLAPFAIDLYLPALPTISDQLGTEIDQLEASVAIFLIGFAAGQLVLGPLSDAIGRMRVLVGGLAVFAVASGIIATVHSINELFVWRFVQAVGAAGSVTVFPMVQDRFRQPDAARVISILMALIIVAPLIAPLLGGYILILAGWPTIFLLLSALGVVSLLLAFKASPPSTEPRRRITLRMLSGQYATVLKERRVVLAILTGSFAFGGLFAFVAGSPFVYITYFDVPEERYGLLVGLNAAAMIIVNLANASILAKFPAIGKIAVGAVFLALAGVAMLAAALLGQGLVMIVAIAVVFFAALALVETNAAIVAFSVLQEENGTVASLNGALQFGIGGLSSMLVSTLASTNAVPLAIVMAASGLAVLLCAVRLVFFDRASEPGSKSRGSQTS